MSHQKIEETEAISRIDSLFNFYFHKPSEYEQHNKLDYHDYDLKRAYCTLLEDACLALDNVSATSAASAMLTAFSNLQVEKIRDLVGTSLITDAGEIEMSPYVYRRDAIRHFGTVYNDLLANNPKLKDNIMDQMVALEEQLKGLYALDLGEDFHSTVHTPLMVDLDQIRKRHAIEESLWENEHHLWGAPDLPDQVNIKLEDVLIDVVENELQDMVQAGPKVDADLQMDTKLRDIEKAGNHSHVTRKTLIKSRDHVVIPDYNNDEKRFQAVSVDSIKHRRFVTRYFVGTESECKAWVNATSAEERSEIERKAEERHKHRVPLPSEAKIQSLAESVKNVVVQFGVVPQQLPLFGNPSTDKEIGKHL